MLSFLKISVLLTKSTRNHCINGWHLFEVIVRALELESLQKLSDSTALVNELGTWLLSLRKYLTNKVFFIKEYRSRSVHPNFTTGEEKHCQTARRQFSVVMQSTRSQPANNKYTHTHTRTGALLRWLLVSGVRLRGAPSYFSLEWVGGQRKSATKV